MQTILVTGGAGFVGSNLAVLLKTAFEGTRVVALDNLKRRGSELSLARLREAGVEFVHGDVRCPEDFEQCPPANLVVDCSAEPSVQAGVGGSGFPVLQHNLIGTIHCVEAAVKWNAAVLFLSTSRVYPIGALNALKYEEQETRFDWTGNDSLPGYSAAGIAEEFPLEGARSLYGATKLASELILQEYAFNYGVPIMINRCGILTGPWQMGKVDQGVITLWAARHLFGKGLRYTGFGGHGKQVRDLLHIEDLFDLVLRQLGEMSEWNGQVFNVGGGREVSISLQELTRLCREATGNTVPIEPVPETSAVDLRIYLTDSSKVRKRFDWRPTRTADVVVDDIVKWIRDHQADLQAILG